VAAGLGALRPHAEACVTDLTSVDDRKRLVRSLRVACGVNVLINNAGLNPFASTSSCSPRRLMRHSP
jgi:short-subunit dehydrogenase